MGYHAIPLAVQNTNLDYTASRSKDWVPYVLARYFEHHTQNDIMAYACLFKLILWCF